MGHGRDRQDCHSLMPVDAMLGANGGRLTRSVPHHDEAEPRGRRCVMHEALNAYRRVVGQMLNRSRRGCHDAADKTISHRIATPGLLVEDRIQNPNRSSSIREWPA